MVSASTVKGVCRLKVKAGDIVNLDPCSYPQYKGKSALVVQKMYPEWGANKWIVVVNGKLHPYTVCVSEMIPTKL